MQRTTSLFRAAVFACFLFASVSTLCADIVVYDSFNPAPAGGKLTDQILDVVNITVGSDFGIQQAAAFTPSQTVALTSFTGAWGSNVTNLPISLWTDANGLPGTEVESWTQSIAASSASKPAIGYYIVNSATHPVLNANQTYWFVTEFQHSTDQDFVAWGYDSNAPSGRIGEGFLPFDAFDFGQSSHAFGLEVQGSDVPEPHSCCLLVAPLLVLLWLRPRSPKPKPAPAVR